MARLGSVTVLALDTAGLGMLVTRRAPLASVEQSGLRGSPGARALAAPEAVLECWAFFALIGELLAVAAVLARRVASITTEGLDQKGFPPASSCAVEVFLAFLKEPTAIDVFMGFLRNPRAWTTRPTPQPRRGGTRPSRW